MATTVRRPAAKKAAPAADAPLVFEAFLNKETKGTFRMDEDGATADNPVTGTIYLKKPALNGRRPSVVRVTVEILEEQDDE